MLDTLEDHALRRRVELALGNHGDDHIASLSVRDLRALLQHAEEGAEEATSRAYEDGYQAAMIDRESYAYTEEDLERAAADAETEGYAKGYAQGVFDESQARHD